MKSITALMLAFAATAIATIPFNIDDRTEDRPRISHIIKHLERNNQLSWKDHELGGGARVAVYSMEHFHAAKQHIRDHGFEEQPQATIAPRAPQVVGASSSLIAATTIGPQDGFIEHALATVVPMASLTTTVASGTSSMMADSTPYVTKWVCQQPYNFLTSLGEGALAAILCQYIFPFFQKKVVPGQGDTYVETIAMASSFDVEAQTPGQTGNAQRMAQVLLHVEKNGLWPALKTIVCSGLIVQIVNNSYCWGYGRNFDLGPPSRIKRQAGVLDATVGGTVTIYDPFGVTAVGLIEMDVYPLE